MPPKKRTRNFQLQQVKPLRGVSLIRGKEAPSCSDAAGGFKWSGFLPEWLWDFESKPKTGEELDDIS